MSTPTMVQTSLFDLMSGRERRDTGMGLAEAGEGTAWGEYAYQILKTLAEELPEVHTDDLERCLEWHPRHPNAAGAVWMRALRNGLLERTGRVRPSKQPTKRAHSYPVYRSLVFRGAAA